MTSHPYPGLRPFARDETFIFFGRETHTHELVRILARTRLLAVTGNSGSGKSSIVRTGLLDALDRGLLHEAGSDWRLADLRPGEAPVERLAEALLDALGFERFEGDVGLTAAMLARGPNSLADLVRQARIAADDPLPADANVLILVDQFEELFRFADHGGQEQAEQFIGLLLAAAQQRELPIYVVITMRSDYLGDCGRFEGLAEAINRGQFLTPRMTREQTISAIEGPATVFGAAVDPRLVNELVNDMGARQDRLPLLQHALNLLWDRARERAGADDAVSIRLDDYRALGGLEAALDAHAEGVFKRLDARGQKIAEVLFRQLTEGRGRAGDLRRPTPAEDIMAAAGCTLAELVAVVDEFRQPGRSFLMPPAGTPILPGNRLDISHESLIRGWKRLRAWAQAEAESGQTYRDLARRAARWRKGDGGVPTGSELAVAQAWLERERPSVAWAQRYAEQPDEAGVAAELLEIEALIRAGQRAERQSKWRRFVLPSLAAAAVLVVVAVVGWIEARDNARQADENAAKATALGEAVSDAQQEILRAYQVHLAGLASEERRTNGIAAWRQVLSLAWPDRLDADAAKRVPEVALEQMPTAYKIQLAISGLLLSSPAMASGSLGGNLDGTTGFPRSSFDRTYIDQSAVVDSSGRWLVAVVDDFTALLVLDLWSGRGAKLFASPDVDALAASPDGTILFVRPQQGIYALRPREPLLALDNLDDAGARLLSPDWDISGLIATGDGERAIALTYDGQVAIYDLAANPPAQERFGQTKTVELDEETSQGSLWSAEPIEGEAAATYSIRPLLFGGGDRLLSLSADGYIWLWDLQEKRWLARSAVDAVTAYALSQDERYLAVVRSGYYGAIEIYELATGLWVGDFDTEYDLTGLDLGQLMDVRLLGSAETGLRLLALDGRGLWTLDFAVADGFVDWQNQYVLHELGRPIRLGLIGLPTAVVDGDADRDTLVRFGDNAPLDGTAGGQAGLQTAPSPTGAVAGRVAVAAGGSRIATIDGDAVQYFSLRNLMKSPVSQGPAFVATLTSGPQDCLRDLTVLDSKLAASGGALLVVGRKEAATQEKAATYATCLLRETGGAVAGAEIPTWDDPTWADRAPNQRTTTTPVEPTGGSAGKEPAATPAAPESSSPPVVALSANGKYAALVEGQTLALLRLPSDGAEAGRIALCAGAEPRSTELAGGTLTRDCIATLEGPLPRDLVVGSEGDLVAAAFESAVVLWTEDLQKGTPIPLPEVPDAPAGATELRLSPGGKHLLVVGSGVARLIDVCTKRLVGEFIWSDPVVRGGFFESGAAAEGCAEAERSIGVWLLEDSGLVSRWNVHHGPSAATGGGSSAVTTNIEWVLLSDHTAHAEAIGGSGDFAVVDRDGSLRVDRGSPLSLPRDDDLPGWARLVDTMLATTPLSIEGSGPRSLFKLPPSSLQGRIAGPTTNGPVSAGTECLRLTGAALAGDQTAALADAEAACARALEQPSTSTSAVAIARARLLVQRENLEDALGLLVLASQAGDEAALWVLASAWQEQTASNNALSLMEALDRTSTLVAFEVAADGGSLGVQLRTADLPEEASLLQLEKRGEPFATLILAQRDFERWQADGDGDAAELGFERMTRGLLQLRALPRGLTVGLRRAFDARRLVLAAAIGDSAAVSAAWDRSLHSYAEYLANGADVARGGLAVDYPRDHAARRQAVGDALLALARSDLLSALLIDVLRGDPQGRGESPALLRMLQFVQALGGTADDVAAALSTVRVWAAASDFSYSDRLDAALVDWWTAERGRLVAAGEVERAALGEALLFSLAAWRADVSELSFAEEAASTRYLAELLPQVAGSGQAVAQLIASREFGFSKWSETYAPTWPQDAKGEVVVNATSAGAARDLAFVLSWAADRAPSALLLSSRGNALAWYSWFLGRPGPDGPDYPKSAEVRLEGARAYVRAAAAEPSEETQRQALEQYSEAVFLFIRAGLPQQVVATFEELLAYAATLPETLNQDVQSAAYSALWTTNAGDFPYQVLLPFLARLEAQRASDPTLVESDGKAAYEREFALLSLATLAGWQEGALPGAVATALPPTDCDRQAAYYFDPLRVAPGAVFEDITEESRDLCRQASQDHPGEPRLLYQLARAMLALSYRDADAALEREAIELYVEAARRDYPGAFASLAVQISDEGLWAVATEFVRAARERAWKQVAAATADRLLATGEATAAQFAETMLRTAVQLGSPEAALRLAQALAAGSLPAKDSAEAYELALIAQRLFGADAAGASQATLLAVQLGPTLEPAQQAAAARVAARFAIRPPATPDLAVIEDSVLPYIGN